MSDCLLRVENLGKEFLLPGRESFWAARAINFELRSGEAFGLVGESGSGKSTLGRLLIGLHEKSEGAVYFRGERLPQRYRQRDFKNYAKHMQMVFQDPYATLNPRFTIGSSIAEPLRLRGERDNLAQRVAQMLERVGLAPAMGNRYPHEFSGGQRQRIGIARALIAEPALLVCDEPVSALDVSVQAQIINLLRELQREMQLTLIFISHDLAVVQHLCDRIAVMEKGRIVELADKQTLFNTPQHAFTQKLLAARYQGINN
ncbi:MAG: oligopeptide/dipeptide transporter, ATP-binding protein [Verrucomicrobiaceae bacterium]|nr:oligopeptide/dipeptide transporter, ATP-binding protein [Verrucomicrobiaceae bacterium]